MSSKLYFGVCSQIAFDINQRFYKGRHYCWVTTSYHDAGAPPSSDPYEIYRTFERDIAGMDRHSAMIIANRTGIIRGAGIKLGNKIITSREHDEIIQLADNADFQKFSPLLYIIPSTNTIRKRIITVDPADRAAVHSEEYIIPDLARKEFEVIKLRY